MELYEKTTFGCSELITKHYSTSFTMGIKTLHKKYHHAIYAIYGFVRYADEIVDTFHLHNKAMLLERFKKDTYQSIEEKISLNPVLHSFQKIVNDYRIEHELIEAFLYSMELDLYKADYTQAGYEEYIYGSAEVVGLMCLRVFCEGDEAAYQNLKLPAKSLGAAFQKVNFLRDMKSDFDERGRVYFPQINFNQFDEKAKKEVENDIEKDFEAAYQGIIKLPKGAQMGVYLAYIYYKKLFQKIKKLSPKTILNERIRIPDSRKLTLLLQTYFSYKLQSW
ncbi:MAG: phytoene/squalene synthase family protein [Cytophagales bacterium]|nr:MAG: phytoene/squalene synthase family protein [Cytophagales bacterium]TAH29677.1 MAG: phytoene/squalene synthase family protein [Cytophagales bacterium]